MQFLRPLMVVLALGSFGAVTVIPLDAAAQSAAPLFSDPGLIEVLPVGTIVGDGSEVAMNALILKPDGSPFTGLKMKVTSSAGSVDGWSEVSPGLYQFTFTAPQVRQVKRVELTLKGKTPDRDVLTGTQTFEVRPPVATGLKIAANPAEIVLGQDSAATVSFELENAAGDLAGDQLLIRSSVGEVVDLVAMGGGRFTARFVSPKINYPQLALVTVSDRRAPHEVFGTLVIPLKGKVPYPVRSVPNSTVILRIAGREFGPVKANAGGAAAVPIIVPPGVSSATQVVVTNGTSTESEIDLRVPETRRVQFVPSFDSVPGDGVTKVPVRFAVATPTGEPDASATIDFSAVGGTVGPARHVGDGVYVADFVAKATDSQGSATVTATVRGSSAQKDTVAFKVLPRRAKQLALRAQPEDLARDATSFRVFGKLTGEDGAGVSNRNLSFSVAGAELSGSVQDLRNGDYRADFTTREKTGVRIIGAAQSPVSGNALARVLMLPLRPAVENDGRATNMVKILTLDEFGYPVPNISVTLQKVSGDGSIPAAVKTDANGMADVFYTAGQGAAFVRLRATAGAYTGSTSFMQVPNPSDAAMPRSGKPSDIAIEESWAGSIQQLDIPREGSASASTVATSTGPLGVVSNISATAEPSAIAPGGRVVLRIRAVDGEGRGVAGQNIELMSSQGSFDGLADLGGGNYSVKLTVPPTAKGDVKVSVSDTSGSTSAFLKIDVAGEPIATADAPGEGWGSTNDASEPSTDPSGATEPTTPAVDPKPAKDADFPWLRVRGSFVASTYRYEQRPYSSDGPLLPVVLAVGGQYGGPMATPIGAEFGVKGWLPNLPYLGFDANLRFSSYAITAAEFNGSSAPDTLYNVRADIAGRYPFDVGNNRFYVGGRAGFAFNDFIVFKGSFDEGRIQFDTLALPGLGLSAEVGGEVGPLFFDAGFTAGLYYFSTYYSATADVNVGFELTKNLFTTAGFTYVTRDLDVIGVTSGQALGNLSDGQSVFRIGFGWQM